MIKVKGGLWLKLFLLRPTMRLPFICVDKHIQRTQLGFDELTLVSPSGARGSVIHEPYLDPDVLMVIESLIPVSFPQAGKNNK